MDQRPDLIRQDIEYTRDSLDRKLDALESRAQQTLDVKHQVRERPWVALGAAVAAGFVLGNLGSSEKDSRYNEARAYTPSMHRGTSHQHSSSSSQKNEGMLSQFSDEIDMLKVAAISTISGLLRDTVRDYVPEMGRQIDKMREERGQATGADRSIPNDTRARSVGEEMTASDREYVKTYEPTT